MTTTSGKGLAGLVVADTKKSKVDGENGLLYYEGYSIFDLAEHASFEEVAFLLLNERLPRQAELDTFAENIVSDMAVEGDLLDLMKDFPGSAHPMSVLRTMISILGVHDPDQDDHSMEANLRKARRLLAKTPTLTAAWSRIRDGQPIIAPRNDLGVAGNFLYMLKGEEPIETEIEATDVYLVLLADHGFNASTFTSRVVTSTDGDIYSAITAAIGALKGPKHGGANEAAMNMFIEIDDLDKVDNWFEKEVVENGRKIMGIGHRVYKAPDPRATLLRKHAEALAHATGHDKWFQIARRLEDLAMENDYFKERKLFANVDYYSAIVLYTLGIKPDMMTPLFAMSRMAGWTANVIEQWSDNRLIRPKANYVGDIDLDWIPMKQR